MLTMKFQKDQDENKSHLKTLKQIFDYSYVPNTINLTSVMLQNV